MQFSSGINLPTYSCALDFDACSYTYEIPPINLVESRNDVDDYISTKSNRCTPEEKHKSYESILLEEIKAEYLMSLNKQEKNNGFTFKGHSESSSNESITQKKLDNIKAITSTQKEIEYDTEIISGDDSTDKESLLKAIIGIAKEQTSERETSGIQSLVTNQEIIVLNISEEILCVNRNNKIEKYEFQGTIGVNHICSGGGSVNASFDGEDLSATMSTMISLVDHKETMNNLKANKSFILTPIQSSGTQKISIENVPKNSEKISPVLRYSVLSSFQPFYFRARSKVKVKLPHAKIYVQIILNPLFKNFLDQMDTLSVQASLSYFLFSKDSHVSIRDSDNFNENTKILTWVCSTIDVDKNPVMQLEASIEGTGIYLN